MTTLKLEIKVAYFSQRQVKVAILLAREVGVTMMQREEVLEQTEAEM